MRELHDEYKTQVLMKHRDRFNAGQLIGTKSLGVRWEKRDMIVGKKGVLAA